MSGILPGVLILSYAFATASAVAGESSISVHTEVEVDAMEGDDARLSCSYDCATLNNDQHTLVQWWKLKIDDEDRIFLKNGEVISSSNIQWAGNSTTCDASILMREVRQKDDSAQYRCEVVRIPSYIEGRSIVKLHVSPSKELPVYAPAKMTVIVGNDIFLNCSFYCRGRRDNHTLVQWWRLKDSSKEERIFLKNGEVMPFHPRVVWRGDDASCNASISISHAAPGDAAQYRCEITYIPSYRQGRGITRLDVQLQPDPPTETTKEGNPTDKIQTTVIIVILMPIVLIVILFVAYVVAGLLCGHRFPVRIPIPKQWRERRRNPPSQSDGEECTPMAGEELNTASHCPESNEEQHTPMVDVGNGGENGAADATEESSV